jgi:predicted flavoprotein YhiN
VAGRRRGRVLCAIACAEADPAAEVTLHEATAHPLAKVRVSGGGRCNVTHACFDAREMAKSYPRGSRELIGPFQPVRPADTVAWFRERGVELKTEKDGRMFPGDGQLGDHRRLPDGRRAEGGRRLRRARPEGPRRGRPGPEGALRPSSPRGEEVLADRVLIATGGTKGSAGMALAGALGHTIVPPVPSLFTFHIDDPRLKGLEGLAAPALRPPSRGRLRETGPILVTHWGLSGPAILRLSAWGARELHAVRATVHAHVNWAEPRTPSRRGPRLEAERQAHPKRKVATANPFGIPARLWERLVGAAGIGADATWSGVSNDSLRALVLQATASEFAVTGKSMNKEEFVTCGGVSLAEVDMATMESRVCPGLTSPARCSTSTGSPAATTSSRPGRPAGRPAARWRPAEGSGSFQRRRP